MRGKYRILVINPGSVATKLGIFENKVCLVEKRIQHNEEELKKFPTVMDQWSFRKTAILDELHKEGINLSKFHAVCGRGGLLRPIAGGTYLVNAKMLEDLRLGFNGAHPSNLGGLIANEIAAGLNIPAYIVDPVVIDEFKEISRFSGFPELPRKSIFHALNQKAVARRVAEEMEVGYKNSNIIVAHMGGGITIGAHQNGRVIDVNNGLHGEGPFTPDRAGTVPAGDLLSLCFSGLYTEDELMRRLIGAGGLKAYLETSELPEVEKRIDKGDKKAELVYDAMAYQIAKEIGAMAVVLKGKVDAIALTGILAESKRFTDAIIARIDWISDVSIYPGEKDLQALAEGTYRVLMGEEKAKTYPDR